MSNLPYSFIRVMIFFLLMIGGDQCFAGLAYPDNAWNSKILNICVLEAGINLTEIKETLSNTNDLMKKIFKDSSEIFQNKEVDYQQEKYNVIEKALTPSESFVRQINSFLKQQFNLKEIGIELEIKSWQNCHKLEQIHSYLAFSSSDRYVGECMGGLGVPHDGKRSLVHVEVKSGELDFEKLRKTSFSFVLIHEFGHLLGMNHELVKGHAPQDDAFYQFIENDIDEFILAITDFPGQPVVYKYTDYDLHSIMSYGPGFLATGYEDNTFTYNKETKTIQEPFLEKAMEESSWIYGDQVQIDLTKFLIAKHQYVTIEENKTEIKLEMLPMLSDGDKHTLKCLYKDDYKKNCKNAKPLNNK